MCSVCSLVQLFVCVPDRHDLLSHGSRCVNNTLIKMRPHDSAVGPESHSSTHFLPLPLCQIQTLIPAHLLIMNVPWCTVLLPSSPVCRDTHYDSGSAGHECSGIIFPNVLPVPELTAKPKSTASLSWVIVQHAWFASFHSILSPVSKMSPEIVGESGIKWPWGKSKFTADIIAAWCEEDEG